MDIGTSFITIAKTWDELKALASRDKLPLRCEIESNTYNLFAIDSPIIYLCTLYTGDVPHAVPLTQEDNDAAIADYIDNFSTSANLALNKKSSYGLPLSEQGIRSGTKTQIISQNFCDKRTWYSSSVRMTNVEMIDSGDGYVWSLPDGYETIADVSHGRVLHERRLRAAHAVNVSIDGVQASEVDPHDDMGDWTLDYLTGTLTFATSQASKTITMSYSKITNSKWYLRPQEGKVLRLISAELQFSTDCRLSDTFVFQARADVSKFPELLPYCTTNGGPYPPGTMIPIGDATYYQTVFDLICEANLAYPVVPKWSGQGATWRDLQSDILVFSWDYGDQASVDISASTGMEIEVSLEHDVECVGTAAVVTFYCLSEDA